MPEKNFNQGELSLGHSPKTFLLPSNLDDLKSLNLAKIVALFNQQTQFYKFAQLDGFKDGKMAPLNQEDFSLIQNDDLLELSRLKKSFRLTNVQLFVPAVARACEELSKTAKGRVFSANLYFTPNSLAQCFVMHSDPQETFVYQVHGQKKWTFIELADGTFLSEKYESNFTLKDYQKGKIQGKEYELNLKEGEALSFGYNLHHRATNLHDLPSVHITFACYRPTLGELVQYIGAKVLGTEIKYNHFEPVQLEEVIAEIRDKNLNVSDFVLEYLNYFNEQEKDKLIHGRPY